MNSPSVLSKMLLLYLQVSGYRNKLNLSWWTKTSAGETPPSKFFEEFIVEKEKAAGNIIWNIKPKEQHDKKYIFYLHGGGYSKSFLPYHWKFMANLINKTGYSMLAPDYPLSKEHTATEVFEFLLPVYQKLIDEVGSENVILLGDSAGGGMGLALAELLVERKIDQPSQIILLSPWLDITLSNPQIYDLELSDHILDRTVMQKLGTLYLGELEATHYLVSPIYGAIRRLAPTTVFVGSEEIFLPDCKKLKTRAESEPMIFNYREFKGMVHNWMFLPLPDAQKALTMIVNQILLKPTEIEDLVHSDKKFWLE